MKHFLTLLSFILFYSCTRVFNDPQIVVKDNRSYDSSGNLLTGKVQYFYQNGIMSSYYFYKDGIPTGSWRLFDLTGSQIQEGDNFHDPDFKKLVSQKYKVDYTILNKWSEGDVHFITAYVGLKNHVAISKDSITDYINYLNKYKIKNEEILFLHNNDTICNVRIWGSILLPS